MSESCVRQVEGEMVRGGEGGGRERAFLRNTCACSVSSRKSVREYL